MAQRTIWKFPISDIADVVEIAMPVRATCISVHEQNGSPCIWAMVDPDEPTETRKFRVLGTGHTFDYPQLRKFLGTVLLFDGALVFHIFEIN